MLQSEVEDHVNNWPQGETRVYKYRLGLNVPHVVTLFREGDLYKCETTLSTYKQYPVLNSENLIKEISSTRLIYIKHIYGFFDPVELRTGGCTCGAFITSEPNMHYRECKLFKGL